MKTDEQRQQDLLELGMDENEIRYLHTPLRALTAEQKISGDRVWERRNALLANVNAEFKAMREAEEAKRKQDEIDADSEAELDDGIELESGKHPAGTSFTAAEAEQAASELASVFDCEPSHAG